MEKNKLMAEALEAFKAKYNELPADAGYPVVREKDGSVYFSRSVESWGQYLIWEYRISVLIRTTLVFIVIVFVSATAACIYFSSLLPALLAGAAYAVWMLAALLLSSFFFLGKKNDEIKEYNGYKKKFYAIV